METVLVATILDGAVLGERLRVEARGFHGQRVVDDQLGRHHRVDLGRVTALLGNRIAQAGQVDQCGLTEDIVADHAGRVPREIQVTLALDDLLQRVGQHGRIAAAYQLLGQHTGGVRQLVVGTRLDGFDGRAGVEVVQLGTGQGFAIFSIHGAETHADNDRLRNRQESPL
ncbi:hypothetical protein D3C80_1600520 [compost metagenome]